MTPTFTPSPEQLDHLLEHLADPHLSLTDIALAHNTTLDALTLFLARPDIAARIEAIESTAARRARLIATSQLATVAAAMARIVQDTDDELAHIPVNPKSLPALEQRRRARETGRRAAALLVRIARFTSVPLTPAPPAARPPVLPPSSASPASRAAPTPTPAHRHTDHAAPNLDTLLALITALGVPDRNGEPRGEPRGRVEDDPDPVPGAALTALSASSPTNPTARPDPPPPDQKNAPATHPPNRSHRHERGVYSASPGL